MVLSLLPSVLLPASPCRVVLCYPVCGADGVGGGGQAEKDMANIQPATILISPQISN